MLSYLRITKSLKPKVWVGLNSPGILVVAWVIWDRAGKTSLQLACDYIPNQFRLEPRTPTTTNCFAHSLNELTLNELIEQGINRLNCSQAQNANDLEHLHSADVLIFITILRYNILRYVGCYLISLKAFVMMSKFNLLLYKKGLSYIKCCYTG